MTHNCTIATNIINTKLKKAQDQSGRNNTDEGKQRNTNAVCVCSVTKSKVGNPNLILVLPSV